MELRRSQVAVPVVLLKKRWKKTQSNNNTSKYRIENKFVCSKKKIKSKSKDEGGKRRKKKSNSLFTVQLHKCVEVAGTKLNHFKPFLFLLINRHFLIQYCIVSMVDRQNMAQKNKKIWCQRLNSGGSEREDRKKNGEWKGKKEKQQIRTFQIHYVLSSMQMDFVINSYVKDSHRIQIAYMTRGLAFVYSLQSRQNKKKKTPNPSQFVIRTGNKNRIFLNINYIVVIIKSRIKIHCHSHTVTQPRKQKFPRL